MIKVPKDYMILSQMMIITGLLDHTRENLEDTCFEDEDELDSLLETLIQGCNIAVLRMKNLLKEAEKEEYGRY